MLLTLLQNNLSSTSKSITVEAASVVVTANNVGLIINRRVTSSTASVTSTFNPIGLRAGRKITSTTGAYTSTLNPIGLRTGRKISVDTQSVAVGLNNIGLRIQRRIAVESQAVDITTSDTGLRIQRYLAISPAGVLIEGSAILKIDRYITGSTSLEIVFNPAELIITRAGNVITVDPSVVNITFNDIGLDIQRATQRTSGGSRADVKERVEKDDNEIFSIIKAFLECQD